MRQDARERKQNASEEYAGVLARNVRAMVDVLQLALR